MRTTVVNIHTSPYDVYIGRPKDNRRFHYGNPFTFYKGTKAQIILPSRDACIETFERWLSGAAHQDVEPERRQWILDHLEDLRGKRLGCFCKPDSCHGDVYVKLLEK